MIATLKQAGFKAVRENRNLLFIKEVEVAEGAKKEAILVFGQNKENKTIMSVFERVTRYNVEAQEGFVFDSTEDDMIRATDVMIDSVNDTIMTLNKLGYNIQLPAVGQEDTALNSSDAPFTPTAEQVEAQKRQEEDVEKTSQGIEDPQTNA